MVPEEEVRAMQSHNKMTGSRVETVYKTSWKHGLNSVNRQDSAYISKLLHNHVNVWKLSKLSRLSKLSKLAVKFQFSEYGNFCKNIPSFNMAMTRTMKGEKSNFQIRASSMKPSCKMSGLINRIRYLTVNDLCKNRVREKEKQRSRSFRNLTSVNNRNYLNVAKRETELQKYTPH